MLDLDSSGYLRASLVLGFEGRGLVFEDNPAPTNESLANHLVDLF
jgi:hypothetical protein